METKAFNDSGSEALSTNMLPSGVCALNAKALKRMVRVRRIVNCISQPFFYGFCRQEKWNPFFKIVLPSQLLIKNEIGYFPTDWRDPYPPRQLIYHEEQKKNPLRICNSDSGRGVGA